MDQRNQSNILSCWLNHFLSFLLPFCSRRMVFLLLSYMVPIIILMQLVKSFIDATFNCSSSLAYSNKTWTLWTPHIHTHTQIEWTPASRHSPPRLPACMFQPLCLLIGCWGFGVSQVKALSASDRGVQEDPMCQATWQGTGCPPPPL